LQMVYLQARRVVWSIGATNCMGRKADPSAALRDDKQNNKAEAKG
jgi:hypothetical protein